MAIVQKLWPNGDTLTLNTSAGGISFASDQNLTGADRQMSIRISTTVGNLHKDVTIIQRSQPLSRLQLENGDLILTEEGNYLILE